MNSQESKFILRAYRADGRYAASDPLFAEALAETARDAALLGWLEREQALDAAVANKIDGIQPPAGLRESILVGARASRPRPAWWQRPVWLAMAAAVALAVALPFVQRAMLSRSGVTEYARFALNDLKNAHDQHEGFPAVLADVRSQLAGVALPFPANLSINLAELRDKKCRAVSFAGHEFFEICFARDGTYYHLYIASRGSSDKFRSAAQPTFVSDGAFASAAWADAQNIYSLVTHAGPDALKRVL